MLRVEEFYAHIYEIKLKIGFKEMQFRSENEGKKFSSLSVQLLNFFSRSILIRNEIDVNLHTEKNA